MDWNFSIPARGQIDEWKIDLITLLKESGLDSSLTPEQREEVERSRLWLCAVIDCRTRVILGISLCKTPTSNDALRALSLVFKDKSKISEAFGCETDWKQHCGIGALVADNGSAFVSDAFRAAVLGLGIDLAFGPAGKPQLRGTIERMFRTYVLQLMILLSGRTFSNSIDRGDYPAEYLAALDLDELQEVFVRFIVDIYHNCPHEGLNGETPANCWDRLSKKTAYATPPSILKCFGLRTKRETHTNR